MYLWFVVSVDGKLGMISFFVVSGSDGEKLPHESSNDIRIRCELEFVRSGLNGDALSHDGDIVAIRSIISVVGEESSVTVWLHPEDVGVGRVEDNSLYGQVAVTSVKPKSSVINGVWICGACVLSVTTVDLDVPGVSVPFVGV